MTDREPKLPPKGLLNFLKSTEEPPPPPTREEWEEILANAARQPVKYERPIEFISRRAALRREACHGNAGPCHNQPPGACRNE